MTNIRTFSLTTSLAISLFLGLIVSDASAGQLYRYKDENGKTVLNSTIPPKYVSKGYDILNDKGRLVQRVPPALTPEQIAARDAEKERQKQLEIEREKQAQEDNELTQLYSHPNDAVRVLSRRVQDIKGVIQIKLGKIDSNRKKIIQLEEKAANIQRNGRKVPENQLAKMRNLKTEITNMKADIEELNTESTKVLADFDKKIKRLEIITEQQATDYPTLLDSLKEKDDKPQQTSEKGITS